MTPKKTLQSLVARGLLTERAMRTWLLPRDELLALLDSGKQAEVVDDLNAVLNAVLNANPKRRKP